MPPIYAHVRGIPGSGKSWLCRKLHQADIICVDTDDLLEETFDDLLKSSKSFREAIEAVPSAKNNWYSILSKEATSRLQRMIKRARKQDKSLVVVGITLGTDIKGIDKHFFMKMSGPALEKAYRRLLRREVAKISDQVGLINRIIDEERLKSISPVLVNVINPAVDITTRFDYYQGMYKRAFKFEKERKTIMLTQPEIIKRLLED